MTRPSFRWLAAAAVPLAAAALLALAEPAAADVLDPEEADELVQELAEAHTRQGICYGWEVMVSDYSGLESGLSKGSHEGTGLTAGTVRDCARWVLFNASITYASESSESEDSAGFSIEGNLADMPTAADLERIGLSESALRGDQSEQAISDAISSLPMLVAEKGAAPALRIEPNESPLPASERATGSPGSDYTRTYGTHMAVVAGLVIAGAGWLWYALRLPKASPVPRAIRPAIGGPADQVDTAFRTVPPADGTPNGKENS